MKVRLKTTRILKLCLFLSTVVFIFYEIVLYHATQRVLSETQAISNYQESVRPNSSTVILEPKDINRCNESGQGLFLLVMVISSPANFDRRQNIRDTWNEMRISWEAQFLKDWKSLEQNENEVEFSRAFHFLFFVGKSADKDVSESVQQEWERHGDLVLDDLEDVYEKLTVKTLRMMKWTLGNCKDAKYLLKFDDDVFLNVPKFLRYLLVNQENPRLLAGRPYINAPVVRFPLFKWFIPRSVYLEDRYPPYVAGFCYVMGMEAVKEIFEKSEKVPLFRFEDIYLTGMIASTRLHIELHQPGPILRLMTDSFENRKLQSISWVLRHVIILDASESQFRCWSRYTVETEEELKHSCMLD